MNVQQQPQQQQQQQQQQPINVPFNGPTQSLSNVPSRANWAQEAVILGQIISCVIVAQIYAVGMEGLFYIFAIMNSVILIGILFWRTRCCTAANQCGGGNSTDNNNVILPEQNWIQEITLIGYVISSLIAAKIGRESANFYVFALLNAAMCVALFLWRTRCCIGNNQYIAFAQNTGASPVQIVYTNGQTATCVSQPAASSAPCNPTPQATSGEPSAEQMKSPPPYDPMLLV